MISTLRAELGALLDTWSLPRPSAGPVVGLSLHYAGFGLDLSGRYLVPRDVDAPLPAGVQARIDLLAGALGAGFSLHHDRFSWGPRAELELGYLHGRSSGTIGGDDTGAFWASAWGGLTLAVRLHERVTVGAASLLGVPLRRPRFALQGEPAFYTTGPVGLRFFLALSVALTTTD
ncbi:MAG: hypothetical protein QM778_33470 [Myxococcales bacterium]